MLTVTETEVDLSANLVDGRNYFSVMPSPDSLTKIINSFFRESGDKLVLVDGKNYFGIRGQGFYDDPTLWGLEVRSLHRSLSRSADPRF